jgi:hypothetical protein
LAVWRTKSGMGVISFMALEFFWDSVMCSCVVRRERSFYFWTDKDYKCLCITY